MFNQIRKLITKIRGEDIFCSPEDEKFILKKLLEDGRPPFSFDNTDSKGKELLEFILSLTKDMILRFNKSIPTEDKKKIYFYFVDKNEINAFATIIENTDVIGINIGVLTNLYDYYNSVIDEGFFPEIKPDSEERKDLVFNLQVMSVLYIICHELGHLYDGHIGFRNINFMKEIHSSNNYSRENILYNKTIELDADAFAMNRMLEFNEDLISQKNKINNISEIDIKQNVLFSYKKLFYSMYSFYLFFNPTFNASDIKNEIYFSPTVRQILNLTIAEEYVSKKRPNYKEKIQTLSDELVKNADFTFYKYYSKKDKYYSKEEKEIYLIQKLSYLRSPEYDQEMLMVRKQWNLIRDDLQKNARFSLAPKYKD